jgi:hypothetical protein
MSHAGNFCAVTLGYGIPIARPEIGSNGRYGLATRYDKLAANYLAFVQLASIRLWLRVNEPTPWFAQIQAGAAPHPGLPPKKKAANWPPF